MTLRVQGGSPLGDGDAVLTAADGSTNHGGVVLESLDGVHHGYFLVPQGSFTNEADGTIRVDLPPGDAGAGSILAGRLEDDGGIADTTGLPVTAALQPALQWSPSYCADDSGSSDGSGSSGDGSSETDAEANQARMAYTPGVDDGVIVVAELNTGPDAAALTYSSTCGYIGPTSSGWSGDSGAVNDLIGSLYNLGQVLIDNTTAGAGLVNGAWNAFQEGVNIVWDAGQGLAGGASVIANQVFGTPTYNPQPQSSLMKGLEAAGAQGQLLPYVGQAAVNVLTLPLSAANAADAAFQSFKNTGDLTPLSQWAGTYGLALFTAAEGGAGLVEGGAGLLQEADAAALEAEMAGLPGGGWAGVLGAAGAPEGLLTFLADESGALTIDLSGDFSSEPGADLVQAEGQLGGAVGGAETEASQLAAEGADGQAAGLVQAAEQAAEAQAAEAAATGATAADTTAAAQALEQQAAATQDTQPADPIEREVERVVRHRDGGQTVTIDGEIWHLPTGGTVADIPAADPVGDRLSELAQQYAAQWDPSDLTQPQKRAIEAQLNAGRPWLAQIYQARYRGSWVANQVEESAKAELPQLQWNARGVDVVDPDTGLQYDILSGSRGNMIEHALRAGMSNRMFRMITFPTR